MRLLADENIPALTLERLRGRGHDVLAIAECEQRILLTFDKDFGELAYSSNPRPSCGITLFRIPLRSAEYISEMIAGVLDCRNDWPGHFAVVEPDRIRLRQL